MELKLACNNILEQIGEIINQIPAVEYSVPVPALGHSTLGQHFRHALEFFECLNNGYDSAQISYDARRHDKDLESEKEIALDFISQMRTFISQVDTSKKIELKVNYTKDSNDSITVPTNIARELIYNIEHVVHHMALVKIGLRELGLDINLPNDFGVAVSTLRYHNNLA